MRAGGHGTRPRTLPASGSPAPSGYACAGTRRPGSARSARRRRRSHDTTTDANYHQTATLVDAFGRTGYDQQYAGNGNSIPYALYSTESYTYDYNGDLVKILQPDGTSQTTFTYDADGNVTAAVDARGAAGTIYAGYDGLDRQTWRNASNSATGAYVTYTYDQGTNGVGRLSSEHFNPSASLGNGSYSYSYDARGETTGETETLDGTSYGFSFGYNDAGQPTSLTYSDGEVLSLSYDASSGWLSSAATTPAGSSTAINLATNISYSGVGGALGQPSAASVIGGKDVYSASYDSDLRLSSVSLAAAPPATDAVFFRSQRTYDAVGNVQSVATQLAAGTDNQAFCYDEQNRLTWAGAYSSSQLTCGGQYTPGTLAAAYYSTGHTYDVLDRLTSATGTGGAGTYSYGDSSHLHGVTSTTSSYSATYDVAGDMTCRALTSATTCAGSTPTGQKLTYDSEGRLTGWQNTWTAPTTTASDAYDGEGQRVAQRITSGGTMTTTDYIAGGLEEQTSGSSGTTLTKYESVPGVIGVVIVGTGTGESVSYLATDGLGSVSEALDGNGHVLGAQLYGPFGGIRYSSGTMPTTKGYTGQYADAASSGLDYYNARYYDPVVGQFTSADTVLAGGLNRYAYVGNNPETATDPSGHMDLEGEDGGASGLYAGGNPNAVTGGGGDVGEGAAAGSAASADITLTSADGTQTQVWDGGNMVTITGPNGEFEGTMAAADDAQLNGSLEVDPATATQQADELKASAHAGEPETGEGPGTTGETGPTTPKTPTNPNEPTSTGNDSGGNTPPSGNTGTPTSNPSDLVARAEQARADGGTSRAAGAAADIDGNPFDIATSGAPSTSQAGVGDDSACAECHLAQKITARYPQGPNGEQPLAGKTINVGVSQVNGRIPCPDCMNMFGQLQEYTGANVNVWSAVRDVRAGPIIGINGPWMWP